MISIHAVFLSKGSGRRLPVDGEAVRSPTLSQYGIVTSPSIMSWGGRNAFLFSWPGLQCRLWGCQQGREKPPRQVLKLLRVSLKFWFEVQSPGYFLLLKCEKMPAGVQSQFLSQSVALRVALLQGAVLAQLAGSWLMPKNQKPPFCG